MCQSMLITRRGWISRKGRAWCCKVDTLCERFTLLHSYLRAVCSSSSYKPAEVQPTTRISVRILTTRPHSQPDISLHSILCSHLCNARTT